MVHAPVRVITVEREYGSHGAEFAHDLAARLGWRLHERLDPWYYRYGKMFWQDPVYAPATGGDEKIFDSERMLELIREQVLEAANEGNCVLVGRGSACALAGRPGCFHIFVYATASAKKDWFARAFPERAQQAEQHLAAFDRRRAAVIRRFYQQEWCTRGLYHMLLNASIGTDAMIAAVQCAAGLCPTPAEPVTR
ncbi:MAG: cytidylate kinase-like family protein [Terracidiphilus sp.]